MKSLPIEKDDISADAPCEIAIAGGLTAEIRVERDDDKGPPWKEHDGHGPVSEWTTRDKRAGERVLASDGRHRRFYDFAEAVKIALRDGWDAAPYHAAFPGETKRQKAARAAEADFRFLSDWANDRWEWIGVCVTLRNSTGNEVGSDSLWGLESCGDYWREAASEMVNRLAEAHEKEVAERAHWEARDTVTSV